MRGDQRKVLRGMGLASTIGIMMVVATVTGGLIGWLIDRAFDTFPLFTVIVGLLGIAAGFVEMFQIVKQITKE